ncbi:MAG: sulfotransferase domain-containing protein [Gammaproteobacteria bacterium]|nr:sulfotransferase domain-containing protein [Gammaproteobacteria bacterium]
MENQFLIMKKEFNDQVKQGNKQIGIFGASVVLKEFLRVLSNQERKYIAFIFDNDISKNNTDIEGIPIKKLSDNFQELKEQEIDAVLIAIFNHRLSVLHDYFSIKRIVHNTHFFNSSIFPIVTIPHSGSAFILGQLVKNIDLTWMRSAGGLFLNQTLVQGFITSPVQFFPESRNGYIIQEHLAPNHENVLFLEHLLKKTIVHIRDPRQVILSMAHHFSTEFYLTGAFPLLEAPANFLELDLTEKLNFIIDRFASELNQWLLGWIELFENKQKNFQIMLTNHEILKNRPEYLFQEIMKFYGIEQIEFNYERPVVGKAHYRKGTRNEWEKVFTEEQKQKVNSIFSDKIFPYVFAEQVMHN